MRQMEHKQFDAIITAIDEPMGIVKAVFSVFGNIDHGGDKIHAGAFAKTFAERGQKVLVLDNHNTQSTGDVIAKTLGLRELSREMLPAELQMKYPEATGGAEITAKFEPDKDKDPKSAAAFYRLKNNWLGEWSFGYDPLDFDFEPGPNKSTVRNIRTIKLYEVSPVLWGMNGATMTTDAKADVKVPWSTALVNTFPDGSFLFIEPGGEKDEEGKTVPRTLRHFVYRDGDGVIDLPHLRNAISRLSQAATGTVEGESWLTDTVRERLLTRARNLLEQENNKSQSPQPETKAGAMLSARNIEQLTSALQLIADILKRAGANQSEDEPMPEDEEIDIEMDGVIKSGSLPEATKAPTSPEAGPPESETPKPETKNYLLELAYIEAQLALLEVHYGNL